MFADITTATLLGIRINRLFLRRSPVVLSPQISPVSYWVACENFCRLLRKRWARECPSRLFHLFPVFSFLARNFPFFQLALLGQLARGADFLFADARFGGDLLSLFDETSCWVSQHQSVQMGKRREVTALLVNLAGSRAQGAEYSGLPPAELISQHFWPMDCIFTRRLWPSE